MTKYLLILAVIAVVYAAVRGQRKVPPAQGRRRPAQQPPQQMVACAHCGVHLPREDALMLGRDAYCCAAHRDKGPA